ncbi:hypothetical protein BQ8482_170114 [Mesorhizobium delmotii]|uniref:Uncharacterized protein n=1 Tax=Mesorhizobium delmotii TaxID=1631247 RepID=A0A2P9AI00_9HYPH|nr:hypothetical protein BQ8482_170114 [Mesorhizobium delmotii]
MSRCWMDRGYEVKGALHTVERSLGLSLNPLPTPERLEVSASTCAEIEQACPRRQTDH